MNFKRSLAAHPPSHIINKAGTIIKPPKFWSQPFFILGHLPRCASRRESERAFISHSVVCYEG